MNTTEKNKLLAEFVGIYLKDNKYKIDNENLKWLTITANTWINEPNEEHFDFHTSWDWLMEVVEKIENLITKDNFVIYDFTIYSDAVIISDQQENPLIIVNKSEEIGSLQKEPILFETKKEAVYNACVEFITR